MNMNEEVKNKWIEALRSGDYEQGRCAMHRGDTFCCLGVLCDVHRKEQLESRGESDAWVEETWEENLSYYHASTILPAEVSRWAGFNSTNPTIEINEKTNTIATHNDTGQSFEVIADAIEKQF